MVALASARLLIASPNSGSALGGDSEKKVLGAEVRSLARPDTVAAESSNAEATETLLISATVRPAMAQEHILLVIEGILGMVGWVRMLRGNAAGRGARC